MQIAPKGTLLLGFLAKVNTTLVKEHLLLLPHHRRTTDYAD
jgi:hypothetical protein